ncbi:MAG: OmpA family protein [Campylobacteraceae bacterium]|jgi:OOP family OmpA-OmpF porin|nr:OmpA family protein [Campylobacteraceae bacterium]
MKKIALAFAASAVLVYAGNSEITAAVGGVTPSSSSKYDNHVTYGVRIGAGIEDALINQLELGYDYSYKAQYKREDPEKLKKSNIHRIYLNAIKEFDIAKSTKLYALVGVGYAKYSIELPTEDNGAFGQYGAGLKYYFNDNTALRAEVRHAIKIDTPHKHNLFYSLGLSYAFGEKKQEAAPTIATAVQQPPVVPVIEESVVVDEPVITEQGEIKGTIVKTISLTQKDFTFATNSAVIPLTGLNVLKDIAGYLTTEENENVKVLIEGHTDSTGSDSYNLKLSQKRADAIKDSLVNNGVATDRIISKGYGEAKPLQPNKTAEGRAANRRVEVIFVQ